MHSDRNRQGGGVVGYVRNDLSYNNLSVFPCEDENIFFFEILITVGNIYRPTLCPPPPPLSQSNFLEVLNDNMNKIDSINTEIYILGDFNINLYLNDSYILVKKYPK